MDSARAMTWAGRVLVALVILLGPAAGCDRAKREQTAETGGEIVRVGDAVLTADELQNLVPGDERVPPSLEEKRQYVHRWIDTELLYQEAVRRGLRSDPRVRSRLRELEASFLADHLAYIELSSRITVSEEEIEEYFRDHEREYLYEYRVSHILTNTIEEAQQARGLLATRSFEWVANRLSVDPLAKRGGDLGYLTKGNMIPEFEQVVFSLQPGAVSEPVKTDFGYHIVKLVEMRETLVPVALDDVREQIVNTLLIERRRRAYAELLEALRASTKIEYRDRAYLPSAETASAVDTAALRALDDSTETPGY